MSTADGLHRDALRTYWEVLVRESEQAGRPATPCGAETCLGFDPWDCECPCGPCDRARALHVRAEIEVADLIAALAEMEGRIELPQDVEDRMLKRLFQSWDELRAAGALTRAAWSPQ